MSVSRKKLDKVFRQLHSLVEPYGDALIDGMVKKRRNPFHVLIATVLSLRTKDEVTGAAAARLFARAATPAAIAALEVDTIAELIYPVGFYRRKAVTVKELCQTLLDEHAGEVPATLDGLLALKGVGRKTANLVLLAGYEIDAICVDTHVHRICNRWGYVETKTADDTEQVLRRILPRPYWREINALLVTFGQNVCKPTSPLCSQCTLADWWCQRLGVTYSR